MKKIMKKLLVVMLTIGITIGCASSIFANGNDNGSKSTDVETTVDEVYTWTVTPSLSDAVGTIKVSVTKNTIAYGNTLVITYAGENDAAKTVGEGDAATTVNAHYLVDKDNNDNTIEYSISGFVTDKDGTAIEVDAGSTGENSLSVNLVGSKTYAGTYKDLVTFTAEIKSPSKFVYVRPTYNCIYNDYGDLVADYTMRNSTTYITSINGNGNILCDVFGYARADTIRTTSTEKLAVNEALLKFNWTTSDPDIVSIEKIVENDVTTDIKLVRGKKIGTAEIIGVNPAGEAIIINVIRPEYDTVYEIDGTKLIGIGPDLTNGPVCIASSSTSKTSAVVDCYGWIGFTNDDNIRISSTEQDKVTQALLKFDWTSSDPDIARIEKTIENGVVTEISLVKGTKTGFVEIVGINELKEAIIFTKSVID